MDGLSVVQLALNTSDLAGTLRLYSEVFGFRNAGGNALWGETIRIQGLDADARSLIWWMVGEQRQFQLELFHHTRPAQRRQALDWRPCDHGWVRFGIRTDDLDAIRVALGHWQLQILGEDCPQSRKRRLAFRDPFVGAVVEVIEDNGRPGPCVDYVACSVEDLTAARQFFGSALGFKIQPLEFLHEPEDEALWELEGANREGFVVPVGEIALEIVSYATPKARPRGPHASIADQGIMNVGLGSRNPDVVRRAIEAFIASGCEPTRLFDNGDNLGTYFTQPGREFELLSVNPEYDEMLGFKPAFPFLSALGE